MNRKKLVLSLVLVLVFAVAVNSSAFFGLFGGGDEDEAVEIRLSGWTSSPTEMRLLREIIEEFEDINPEIKVNYEPIEGEYMDRLQTQIAGGQAPDVFYVDSVFLPALAARNVLHPLDDFMAESGVSRDEFLPGLIDGFQFEGKQYGIPKDYSTLGLFYNTRMFAEAGIDGPPEDWDELYEYAKKMTKDTTGDGEIDQWGMTLNDDMARWIVFLYQNGGAVLNEDMTKTELNSPEAIEALEFYYGLYEEGYAVLPGDVGGTWLGDALGKDNVGMVITGNWTIPFMEDTYPDVEYDVAHLPKNKERATMAFTVSYSIARDSDHPEEAWKLINYLTNEAGQKRWTELGLALPSRADLADMNYFENHPKRNTLMEAGEYARPWTFNTNFQPLSQRIANASQSIRLGEATVKEAMASLERELNQILESENN